MGASVRTEDEAFSDERFTDLARAAGLVDADHARGKMSRLWRQCTIETTYILPRETVIGVLGDRGVEAIVCARLGEEVDGGIRIRGTRGRIEWLRKLRQNGKFGKRGGRPKRNPDGLPTKPIRVTKTAPNETPPTPAPVPTPIEEEERRDSLPGSPVPRPPTRAEEIADLAISEINRLSKSRYLPSSESAQDLAKGLAKRKRTDEEILLVIRSKAKWIGDPEMAEHFCPDTLLGPKNFTRYLDAARATSQGRNGTLRLVAPSDDDPPMGPALNIQSRPETA